MQITLPASDAVSTTVPYRLAIDAPTDLRQTPWTLGGSVCRAGDDRAVALDGHLDPAMTGAVEATLDVAALAAGRYHGELIVTAGDTVHTQAISFYRVAEPLDRPFPYGIYAVPFSQDSEQIDALLGRVAEAGFNFIANHDDGLDDDNRLIWDRLARTGIRMWPSIRHWAKGQRKIMPDGEHQVLADGTAMPMNRCFRRESYRAAAAAIVETRLRDYRRHPAFAGAAFFGDDLFIAATASQGRVRIGCYCEACRAAFRDATGLDAPTAPAEALAAMPADDPWLLWMRHRCESTYGGFVAAIEAARQRVDPAIQIGLVHGAPDNPFTGLECGIYGPMTQRLGVVSSYCYPYLRSPAVDLIAHYEIGKMGNRHKDVWQLGVVAADMTPVPAAHVQQNYWNMIAAGYRAISFFAWWDIAGVEARGDETERWRLDAAVAALNRCGAHKDWILPVAKTWQREPAAVAVLYSFTTDSMNIAPEFRGNEHSKAVTRLYRLALAANLPMEVVSEDEVAAGILGRFVAICLPDARHLPEPVLDALAAYCQAGGQVYIDPDYRYTDPWKPRVKATIDGALEVAPETAVQLLVDQLKRPIVTTHPDVTLRRFVTGDAEYAVLVNNYADRYWGMSYTYGNPAPNFAKSDLMRDQSVDTTVRFAAAGQTIFDLSSGERVGSTDEALSMTLAPSWGRVLMTLPTTAAILAVAVPAQARQGETVPIRLSILDPAGALIAAAFAAEIVITSPSGRRSAASGFVALAAGVGTYALSLGVNDETGRWTIEACGGFPRTRITKVLDLRAGHSAPVPVAAAAFAT